MDDHKSISQGKYHEFSARSVERLASNPTGIVHPIPSCADEKEKVYSKLFSRNAGIMLSFITHYCQSNIKKYQETYNLFALPFQQRNRNPLGPLIALDTALNAFYFNSPLQELAPVDRKRSRPNLKIWARMTVDALNFSRHIVNTDELSQETDKLVAHLFCHWDNLVRALTEARSFEGYDEDQRTQDIIEICNILAKAFPVRIKDEYNALGKLGKHAVPRSLFQLILGSCVLVQSNGNYIKPRSGRRGPNISC